MRISPTHGSFLCTAFVALAGLAGTAGAVSAQANGSRPNVFFDCNGPNCNNDYYRTEIGWVNWVRDAQDAGLHVIMTSLATGAGGRQYTLDFIGVAQAGYSDQLLYQTLPTDTEREALDGLTTTLALGLARFANAAGYRGLVRIEGPDPEEGDLPRRRLVSQDEVDDPWNLWVFRINGNMNLDGEETRKNTRFNGSVNASRVTPTWKLNFNANGNYEDIYRRLSSGDFEETQVDWGFRQLTAYSVADHWSVGLLTQAVRMTEFNTDFRWEVTPAIEYSFFPYEEATRRSLTAFYQIGPAHREYIDTTIYNQVEETRWEQSMEVEFSQRQTWGDASFTLRGSHFLHDTRLYNVSLRGNFEFRIVRGFSINARGDVAWVKDQIYIPREDVSDEQALLDLRRQATSYNYGLQVGFSLQFGSIFNNVVNNRFRGVPGFGGFGGGGFGGGGGGRGR